MNKKIKLYNTISKQKEEFKPFEPGTVKIYSCGPTVYSTQHIGNLMAAVTWDTLKRMFRYFEYEVEDVVNITDVGHLVSDDSDGEDKMQKASKKENKDPFEIARFYEKQYFVDLEKLGVIKAKYIPRASEEIKEQIEIVKSLEEGGYTYSTSDGVYFDVSKFKEYGKLSGQSLEDKQAGARVEENSEKRNPQDFALWKFCVGEHENHLQRWESPWGVGFPGWHIECSAMGYKYLGANIDIHTGGIEHIPVHHENEIAQNQCSKNSIDNISYWLHNAHLIVDGEKMSKSIGNVFYISDFEKMGINPLAFREVIYRTHYRKTLNFTVESLAVGDKNVKKINDFVRKLDILKNDSEKNQLKEIYDTYINKFEDAIADDLNMPNAISAVYEFISEFNRLEKYSKCDIDTAKEFMSKTDSVLGLIYDEEETPLEVIELAQERKLARDNKDFEKSDLLRDEIKELGYEVKDSKDSVEGFILSKIN